VALHGAPGDAGVLAMVRTLHCVASGGVDHLDDAFVLVGSGPHGAELVVQIVDPVFTVSASPLADGDVAQSHAMGDGGV